MINNSRRGGQVQQYLENMLALIQEISKKTENFDELRSLLPLVGQLKKAQLECKQIAEILKQTTDNLPKMKSKILSANRGGDSLLDIYDRMIGHLHVELTKLHSGLQVVLIIMKNISSQAIAIEKIQEDNIKNSSIALIKQIEELLISNKKVINDQINSKRKEYLCQGQKDKYLKTLLKKEINKKDEIKKMILINKYQFGQFRCLFNAYEDYQNKKQFGGVKQSQEIQQTLIRKNQLQKRRRFLLQAQQHIQKQYHFVTKNLRLLQSIEDKQKYQQKLFYHYHSWAKRISITLQTIIIKISSYQSQKTNIKQQQKFLQNCREKIVKYDSMLKNLSGFI